jgi:predicted nucleic acid-binding protein
LLIDDRDGTAFAIKHGLSVIGTLAVLEQAASQQLLALPDTVERLRQTSFRISEELIIRLLERDAARKK